jgi:hypothetical protein
LSVGRGFFGLEVTEAVGVGVGDFEVTECGADGVAFAFDGAEFDEFAGAGGDNAHDGFVGLDFHDVCVAEDIVSGSGDETDDGGLGDGFAELGHEERDAGHGKFIG